MQGSSPGKGVRRRVGEVLGTPTKLDRQAAQLEQQTVRLDRRVDRVRDRVGGQQERLTTLEQTGADQRAELDRLRARVAELEDEVAEQQALGRRVAELADLVTELLTAAASGDRDAFASAARRYAEEL